MHIAYVSDQRYPAMGTDRAQIVTMCSAFGSAGARVTLYHLADDSQGAASAEEVAAHYEVAPTFETVAVECPRTVVRGLEKLALARSAARCIARGPADLVYSRNLPAVMAGLALTDRPTFYETYRPWPAQRVDRSLLFRGLLPFEQLRGLILHSQLAADSYLGVGYSPERVLVAYNGYDPAVLGEPLTRVKARQRLGLPDRFTVTYAGDVMPSKGLDVVLDMAEGLPEAEFVLVGSKGRGPIERRAESLGNVQVFGWRKMSEVSPFLFAADVLVIPPTAQPLERAGHTVLPIKSFYYLAAGRPVLAGDTPDLREVIVHERNGLLVPPGDVGGAVDGLRRLMQSEETWRRLSDNARADGSAHTWTARAQRVLAFLESRR